MPIQGSPEINVQRLAELVRLQQRENEDKRKWDDEEEDEEVVEAEQPVQLTQERPVSSPSPPTACISPPAPPSPGAGSSSGSESGREEKRRRLDLLLHKKFESVTAGCGSPPSLNHEPPSDLQPPRRGSQGSGRRKQAHPSSPGPTSPPSISLRPPADLFPPPPAAASSPRERTPTPLQPRDLSQRTVSPDPPSSDEKEAVRAQLLQMQMLQGLSGLSQAQGGLSNPLLYYTYYTQMVAAMQAQQQKLLEAPQQVNNNHLPMVKDLLSPLRQSAVHRVKHDQDARNPYSRLPNLAHSLSPSKHLLVGGSPSKELEEPRKRAPRALTGRYVRTGTAASPHVLQILRKKIEQRLKLKELLGGDHVFFGGIKNIKASPSKAKKKV